MVSAAFQGVSRVARSRAVHGALATEFGPPEQGGMHALALTLRTPEEHAGASGKHNSLVFYLFCRLDYVLLPRNQLRVAQKILLDFEEGLP